MLNKIWELQGLESTILTCHMTNYNLVTLLHQITRIKTCTYKATTTTITTTNNSNSGHQPRGSLSPFSAFVQALYSNLRIFLSLS